jgi:hypothetical protein
MPVEVALWRLGATTTKIDFARLDAEKRLEDILAADIAMVDPGLLLIGRQVPTAYGKFIDLLALDSDGSMVVLELKRDQTPREIVAQLLDYGSWIRSLDSDAIESIFAAFLKKYHPEHANASLSQAFCERFNVTDLPEELNESHKLTMVAGELDASTERIIKYLAEVYGVAINAVFFRYFKDGDREYLTRAWLIDPGEVEARVEEKRDKLPWNNEFYVSFGHLDDGTSRHWEDARRYGFVSAGGGDWYVRTLSMLEPGNRIWVNIPATGYVGVGRVESGPVPADQFLVPDSNGKDVPITSLKLQGNIANPKDNDPGTHEHLVRVKWLKTVPITVAIRRKGFFGNQNSAAKPRSQKWAFTIQTLRDAFGIND